MKALLNDGAIFDPTRAYRYRLWRDLGGRRVCGFVLYNPSSADERADDPTLRRCLGFARREGCGRAEIVNVFGLVSTKPKGLLDEHDPVGPDNDRHIAGLVRDVCATDGVLIVGWGAMPIPAARLEQVRALLRDARPMCLGTTGKLSGYAPRHPLYVRGDAALVPWAT